MTNTSWFWVGLLTITTVGCMGAAPPHDEVLTRPEKPKIPPPPAGIPFSASLAQWSPGTPDVLTWTSGGDLALVDGTSGAVKQARPTANLRGAVDLIYDPWQARAVVFEADPNDQSGEIACYAVVEAPLGRHLDPRLHEAWIDGDARLLPSPRGIVVFEESYGERWRVLFNDEETSASVVAPPPASAWITGSEADFTIHALTYTDLGLLQRRAADVAWDVIASPVTSGLNVAAVSSPPTARLLHAPSRGDALLFDVAGSDVAVRVVNGPNAGPASLVPLGEAGLRIEDVIAFDGGEVALLLLSGESRLLAVETDATGAVIHTDTLALPGEVRQEKRFFSHDLARVGAHRALAATSAGVFSFRVDRGGSGVTLTFEPSFDGSSLRGPLATISPKPL